MNLFPWNYSFRLQCFLGFLASFALIAFALAVQFIQNLIPCSLCISQRLAYAATGFWFGIAALHGPTGRAARWIYSILALLSSLAGALFAARQVWLQAHPFKAFSSCAPSFAFLRETHGWAMMFKALLFGTGDCAKIDWVLWSLTMPQWSLICFSLFALYSVMVALSSRF